MERVEVRVKMLTPLWTGGVDGTMDRVHETGIIGSLRWWYEAIVRGLGGHACDPTDGGCKYERKRGESHEEAYARLCDVCKMFGCTGWRRRFRLEVVDDDTTLAWTPADKTLNVRPPDRNRGWYLLPGKMGRLRLRLAGETSTLNSLVALLLFLERRGALGARSQLGYGAFALDERAELRARANSHRWRAMGASGTSDADLPDLRRFGFFRYRFRPEPPGWWTRVPGMERVAVQVQPIVSTHATVPMTPALKNEWRFHRWTGSRGDEKWMFGTLRWRRGNETVRLRSKVAASWAYKRDDLWETHGWVWLQKPAIAEEMWEIIRTDAGWQAVLPAPGQLETAPAGPWREWTEDDVVQFLEKTR